jgi:hypothetical protein
MIRSLTALCLAITLAVPLPIHAQKKAVPLKIIGETVLIVKALPFKVIAPEGAGDYTWVMPGGVEGSEDDNVLTVTKAPAGVFVIRVKMMTIDFELKKIRKETGEVTVTLGEVPDPKPPPDPSTALQKAVKDAFTKESVADKKLLVLALAEVYGQASGHVTKETAKTYGQLFTIMTAGVEAAGVKGKLPNIKGAIEANTSMLHGKNTTAIDDSNRKKLADELALVSEALREAAR